MRKNIFIIIMVIVATIIGSLVVFRQKSQVTKTETKIQSTQSKSEVLVSVFAKGLDVPWSIAFLPDGDMLVTERRGSLRLVSKDGVVRDKPITIIKEVKQIGEGGLLGVVIDPEFPTNNFVYLYFTYAGVGDDTLNRVVRYELESDPPSSETSLRAGKIIVDKIPGSQFHNGGRIKFGPDFFLYITTGDAQDPSSAQNKNSLAGKILRVSRYGQSVDGNTFGNNIYSYGHSNPQGITWDDKGNLWETEHGPSGIWPNCCQDELNKIEIGKNYGWPDFVGDKTGQGIFSPILHSNRDVWAPAGLAYFNGSLYFGGLRGEALYRYNIESKKFDIFFQQEFGRIREVILGPDNFLYITTSNRDGRGNPNEDDDKILKIDPKKL